MVSAGSTGWTQASSPSSTIGSSPSGPSGPTASTPLKPTWRKTNEHPHGTGFHRPPEQRPAGRSHRDRRRHHADRLPSPPAGASRKGLGGADDTRAPG